MRIAFLIQRSSISGGTYVVFQHALHASQSGHDVIIVTLSRQSPHAEVWHPAVPLLRFVPIEEAADVDFDIVFGTLWSTMLELHRLRAKRYAYFVQSIESRFYPAEQAQLRALVDTIYGWNVPGITEATWIRDYLAAQYGARYHLVRNGIRKDLYRTEGPRLAEPGGRRPRILVEGSFGLIKNTARALAVARHAACGEIWLLTMSDIPWFPGVQRVFTSLPVDQVPLVYRSCDLILKLSLVEGMFGPPLEMFHCGGTAVVYDVSGHDEYIVHEKNALVVPMHDETGAMRALKRLAGEPRLMDNLKRGALETAAAWPDWKVSSAQFLEAIQALCDSEPFTRDRLLAERETLQRRFQEQLNREVPSTAAPGNRIQSAMQSLRRVVRRYRAYAGHVADSYR